MREIPWVGVVTCSPHFFVSKGLVIKYRGGGYGNSGVGHEFFKSQIGVGHENFKDILGGYLRISSAK